MEDSAGEAVVLAAAVSAVTAHVLARTAEGEGDLAVKLDDSEVDLVKQGSEVAVHLTSAVEESDTVPEVPAKAARSMLRLEVSHRVLREGRQRQGWRLQPLSSCAARQAHWDPWGCAVCASFSLWAVLL